MAERLQLVKATQAGDSEAFAELVEMHYGMVHGLAFSKVHDWTVAEDLTQDTFMTAWANIQQLKHPEAFLVWLRRITRNLALNWLRVQGYRRKLLERNEIQRPETGGELAEDPSAYAARQECLAEVGEGVRTLSPKLRDAIVLYHLEGHTVAECAQMLGISADTMKKRLRLGREKLHGYYRRKADYELEQLLPYKPKRRIEHVVAGLALGPVWPDLSISIAKVGPSMVLQDLARGASLSSMKASGLRAAGLSMASLTPAGVATVATVLAIGAGAVLVVEPGSGPGEEAVASESVLAVPGTAEGQNGAPLSGDSWDGVRSERYVLVENLFGGSVPSNSGLEPGDRLIKVNGLPISASIREDPRSALTASVGTIIGATVLRASPDAGGALQEVEVSFKVPYLPKRYGQGP